jgi:UPF0716 protein FxsA
MPLLLLFVVLPAVELYLLIAIGAQVGAPATLGLIVLTGVVGATLVRRQGLGVYRRIQAESQAGRLPAIELVEGLVLLLCGALLVTPGLITDAVGFAALVPVLRRRFAKTLADRIVAGGPGAVFRVGFGPPFPGPGEAPGARGREGAEPGRVHSTPSGTTVVDVESHPVDDDPHRALRPEREP